MANKKTDVREFALTVFATNVRLIATGNELVAPLGLTSAWWQILAALRYSPVPLPIASIARNMGLTRQAVQRIVDLLAYRELVEFRDNPHHRRARLVVLTDAGIAAVTSADQAAAALDAEIANRVGTARIGEMVRTLEAINTILAEWLDSATASPVPIRNRRKQMIS
ncbi:MarR family transcriptional regulator [Erythrobacter sp. 3-20A1M]|mgnify:FL=1|uniref:MarR family winged helix-turn-helix transcriptional regulator n=1 Tax=Erythrobacter sp. 3-20A1M TaxID=2653850 RepID=UPI001BFC3667|nr:helix-turn-helix domain-containing protein [Erythrobacter sp. 3-20A1M]QWC57215.1 MarR family transcriptional regulator [Erythrobacter sp. 3-20A1M]|tara:strand:- start:713 stop:1213 length:501 start_codon:yes stop_codon:yes gene_type:complete